MLRDDHRAADFDPSRYFPAPDVAPSPPEPAPRRRRWPLVVALLFGALVAYLLVTAPLSKSLQPIAAPGITLLSSDGTPIARRGAVTDQPVDLAALPDHVGQAFVAIEDRRFYDHPGIDLWGIGRAAARNLLAGSLREGGSTITQQLAKLAFLNSDRTAARKLRELMLAFWLEAWLSKDQILSRYVSSAYFGDNVYGLRAAAHHYFSRDPEDLTVEQAALLAGLMKAPSRLAPTSNLSGARERADLVLAAMAELGFISEADARDHPRIRLKVAPVREIATGTYFADWVFPQARAAAEAGYGEQEIVTTLDDDIQRAAVAAVRRAGLGGAQVALVAMRPDGEVVAMVGGKSYKASRFNRATQAQRQPGSTFKRFVYLAALRAGMTPDDRILDAPVTIGDWSPKNSDGRYRGLISLREAFAVSSNAAAVRLSERVGRDQVVKAARDLGVTAPLTGEPSLALGTSGVSLLEMTAAYAAVAGGRYPVKARGLPEAEAGWLEGLMRRGGTMSRRTVQPMLLDLLGTAVERGTGRAAALGTRTYGKTGTTQDSRDAIFIGFAGDLVAAVWVGNDDNTARAGASGGGLPARIWRDFMVRAKPAGVEVAPTGRRAPRVELPPAEVTVPLDELGIDVGAEIGPDGVTFSTSPQQVPPPGEQPPADIPFIAPPPPEIDEVPPEAI